MPTRSETDLHPAYRLSGIARPVDPAYPTNKAVLILIPVVFVIALVVAYLDGNSWAGAASLGLNAGLVVFICWATTRELSPDDNPAGFLAVGLTLAVWGRVGPQSILVVATALMAARLVNRSTGLAAKPSDSVVLGVGFAALAWFVSWTCGVVGALALVLDAVLPSKLPARRYHAAVAVAVAATVAARVWAGVETPQLPAHLGVWASIAGLGLIAVVGYPTPASVGDVDQQPLDHTRVRAGLALGVLAAVLVSLDPGVSLFQVAGLWACVLASVLGLPLVWLRRRRARADLS